MYMNEIVKTVSVNNGSNLISIHGKQIVPKEYEGVRVVTFKDIDELHERPDGTASRNFRQNREYFVENEDYFVINQPDEIRRLGFERPQGGIPEKVILITESGYLMIVKSLKDKLAWAVQRELVNNYFRSKQLLATLDSYMIDDPIKRAERWIEEEKERQQLRLKVEADKPKVEFANHVADTSDLIDIGTLAKLANDENIPIGRNKLFQWLRTNYFLMSKGEHKNEPYQKCIDNGWFVVKEYAYKTPYGNQVGTKTYVTGKGQMYIIERLRKDFT